MLLEENSEVDIVLIIHTFEKLKRKGKETEKEQHLLSDSEIHLQRARNEHSTEISVTYSVLSQMRKKQFYMDTYPRKQKVACAEWKKPDL